MKTRELIDHARLLVAFGDELEQEEGYKETVEALIDKADDKLSALAHVIGVMARSADDLNSRSEENALSSKRYRKRLNFLISMAKGLAEEHLQLAVKDGDEERANRLRAWLEADLISRGFLLTMPTAASGTEDYEQRRWAYKILATPTEDMKGLITEAVKTHDEPLMASRMLILAGEDRAAHLDSLIKELEVAKKRELSLVDHVKALAERRLNKTSGYKATDSLGGWIRITERSTLIAVSPDWDFSGRPKDPDVDKLPEEFVKVTREPKKKDITARLKAIEKAKADRVKLAGQLELAETDEDKAEIKAKLEAIVEPPAIMGARLHPKLSRFISKSK
jgi:hypothetical protein